MKRVLVGVTGGIAAYKSCDLVSKLVKEGIDVEVIMTENACEFVRPLTFSSLTHHTVYTDTFKHDLDGVIQHIHLAQSVDCIILCPATANTIAKIAHGIGDNLLTSTILAATAPILIAPAMNTVMYENKLTQENISKLKNLGYKFIEPATGHLACGTSGKGKLADVDTILDAILYELHDHPLLGKNVLVTAGPTQEKLDPVRFISNHSSGKMGYSIAKAARNLGANVTLISGPTSLKAIEGITTEYITSANELFEAVKKHLDQQDYIIKAAAVGDYRPESVASEKIKKKDDDLTVRFVKNPDILAYIGEHKTHQIVCGFAMETQDLIENATKKLNNKNCDMIIANNLKTPGAGFKGDTNVITMIQKSGIKSFELMQKDDIAYLILEEMMKLEGEQSC